jgi:hypothetical protein
MASTGTPYLHSSGLEKVLEHRFIAELTTCLWLGGCQDFEVLRSEVDASGYDLVVEARGVLRHIQLKSMVRGGKRRSVSVNLRLASKPAGCVVWLDYDPATLHLGPFRWFGTLAGLGLPDSGEEVARHTKGDSTGAKNPRVGHRVLRRSKFIQVETIADLVPFLFGCGIGDEIQLLQHSMSEQPDPVAQGWVREVHAGRFDAVPEDLRWEDSVHLAHLVDGYGLAQSLGLGDPFDFEAKQFAHAIETCRWAGGPAVLWTTLFLEHRRWRQACPVTPDSETELLLDRLCRQLATSLKSALSSAP